MFLHSPSPSHSQRIISLVPSITELLYDINLTTQVIGITKFCVHPPEWFQTKEKIGGTKNVQLEKIQALQPDLIIASKEENVKDQIEFLADYFPVYLTDVNNYEDAIKMINNIGELTSKTKEAMAVINSIQSGFNSITKPNKFINTAYLIWKDPYMTVGGDTFINDMLQKVGLQNIFNLEKRYPQIDLKDLANLNPQLLLLSSEPYPFKEKHIKEIQAYLPNTKVILVDGEMFSWYGSRMKYMPAYFNKILAEIIV